MDLANTCLDSIFHEAPVLGLDSVGAPNLPIPKACLERTRRCHKLVTLHISIPTAAESSFADTR